MSQVTKEFRRRAAESFVVEVAQAVQAPAVHLQEVADDEFVYQVAGELHPRAQRFSEYPPEFWQVFAHRAAQA